MSKAANPKKRKRRTKDQMKAIRAREARMAYYWEQHRDILLEELGRVIANTGFKRKRA